MKANGRARKRTETPSIRQVFVKLNSHSSSAFVTTKNWSFLGKNRTDAADKDSKGELSPVPATAGLGVLTRVMVAEKESDARDCLGLIFTRFFVWI